ncbi:MAG TPA: hypothetical protein VHO29_08975 [Marmoricola sp.]|nr:hypothetical protein [Marmoricola sp.]
MTHQIGFQDESSGAYLTFTDSIAGPGSGAFQLAIPGTGLLWSHKKVHLSATGDERTLSLDGPAVLDPSAELDLDYGVMSMSGALSSNSGHAQHVHLRLGGAVNASDHTGHLTVQVNDQTFELRRSADKPNPEPVAESYVALVQKKDASGLYDLMTSDFQKSTSRQQFTHAMTGQAWPTVALTGPADIFTNEAGITWAVFPMTQGAKSGQLRLLWDLGRWRLENATQQ